MWQSFIKELLGYCTIQVRISDNVLEIEDWPIDELKIKRGKVVMQKTVHNGRYVLPPMVGWTSAQVIKWTRYDCIGSHPEQYYEVFGAPVPGRIYVNPKEL